ncbi:type VI secretion system baseplate subunit TssE [Loktanella salsilacus]|jgi:type VI secretion system protein ImpF|uniref:type VI secretion system baseplate subunit TssE n=1 Tax=Loktanella salsilacus TaxID=195913 RepID=UPI0020B8D278|nr:type VI secretion system baseplate subunit TssE [Loktanella salsilacus]UTH47141.1 type VI secretion system baseplate subunit TssE [Loktanella salsilacus]
MADKTITERLQPSLLDRLTDDEPGNKTESRDSRVINLGRLRDIVRRDLAWLLNSSNMDSILDSEAYPHTSRSVLNYGIRDASGDFSTENRADAIRTAIELAITRFETRIIPGTLEVTMRETKERKRAVVDFDIHADMWAQPVPMELYLRSQVDLITGELSLDSRA